VSAKLTLILFIMICFEIGFLLVFLPWHRAWSDNSFLYYTTQSLDAPWIRQVILSGYFRGAVTGLGLLNILIGVREIFNFSKTVRAITGADPLPRN
jgi:hypothetical protein